MTIPVSGQIKFSDIRSEMNTSGPVRFSDFYKGRSTPNLFANANVPSSGIISISNLKGAVTNTIIEMPNPNQDPYTFDTVTNLYTNGTYIATTVITESIVENGKFKNGLVYIFNASNGSLVHKLYNPNVVPATSSVPDSDNGDAFGSSVAINSSKIVIGAWAESSTANTANVRIGKAYVYNLSDGQLLWQLDNPDETCGHFGTSVAITDEYIIVSAPGTYYPVSRISGGGKIHFYSANTGSLIRTVTNPVTTSMPGFGEKIATNGTQLIASNLYQQTAHIYNLSTGSLLRTLSNPNINTRSSSDGFAQFQIAISNTYAAVAAGYEDGPSGNNTGRVYVFRISDGALISNFSNPNTKTGPGPAYEDMFAQSGLGMNDSVIVVGAQREGDSSNTQYYSGAIYVFNITAGALQARFDNPNTEGDAMSDTFGSQISMNGNIMVTKNYDGDANSLGPGAGKSYVYNVSSNTKLYTIENPNANSYTTGAFWGRALAVNDDWCLISTIRSGSGGVVSVYNTSTLTLARTIVNPNYYTNSKNDLFGEKISLSGNTAIITALYDTDGDPQQYTTTNHVGTVHAYDLNTGTKLYTLTDPMPNSGLTTNKGNFGTSVSISGSYVVVSSPYEYYSNTITTSNSYSGRVYVYNSSTGSFVREINNPNPRSSAQYDQFGYSVSLSNTTLVASARGERNSSNTYQQGTVYMINVTTGSVIKELTNPVVVSSNVYNFGENVLIKGNYILVTSSYGATGNAYSGQVHVYNSTTGNYIRTLANPNPYGTDDSDIFGIVGKMDIIGDLAIIGAPSEDPAYPSSSNGGVVYVFDLTTGNLVRTILDPDKFGVYVTAWSNNFGYNLGVNSKYLCYVSAPGAGDANSATNLQSGTLYRFHI